MYSFSPVGLHARHAMVVGMMIMHGMVPGGVLVSVIVKVVITTSTLFLAPCVPWGLRTGWFVVVFCLSESMGGVVSAGRGGAFPVAVMSVGCCIAERTVCCLWGK